MRHLVIGDIHGRFTELQTVLALAGYREKQDHLIGLGDYINRPGRESRQVMEFLYHAYRQGRASLLCGNHEYCVKAAASGVGGALGELFGVYNFQSTVRSYGHDPARFEVAGTFVYFDGRPHTGFEFLREVMPEEHLRLFFAMKPYLVLKNVCDGVDLLCCHAGLMRDKSFEDMIREREEWIWMWGDEGWTGLDDDKDLRLPSNMVCVYGHFHYRDAPVLRRGRIGIGSALGVLAFCPEERKIWDSDGSVHDVMPETVCPARWLKKNGTQA